MAVNYRDRIDAAKETVAAIEAAGGEALAVPADVRDAVQVGAMFDHVEEALGPVGILVNNAGVRRDALAARISDEMWDEVLATNLTGGFTCSRRALRTMIRSRWGRIVNVSSVAGVRGSIGQANYAAAKAGLIGVTRTLAREVARKNITINAVAPGLVDTELTAALSEERKAELLAEIPAGRAGTPDDIAEVIAFLCSEEAGYVTGEVVVADGGMTA